MPPLRERPEDVVELANFYLNQYNREFGMDKRLSLKAIKKLQQYPFPGNVRELKNILKHGVVMGEDDVLDEILPDVVQVGERINSHFSSLNDGRAPGLEEQLRLFERSIIEDAMRRCKTTRKMAEYLKTSQSRIARMLKKHQLSTTP